MRKITVLKNVFKSILNKTFIKRIVVFYILCVVFVLFSIYSRGLVTMTPTNAF